jgi:hypothetical protein
MKMTFAVAAAVAGLLAMTAADANAWTRNSSVTGPNGRTVTRSETGSCAYGSCSRQGTVTGPNGNQVTYGSSTTCANGTCTHNGHATGPNGRTVTRKGTWTRY